MPTLSAWQDPGCPIPVSYSRDALEQIRRLAVDGLLQLPRVGLGVGGLLLGVHEKGRITIVDSVPLPCSHADGPSFRLTAAEIEQALEIVRATGPLKKVVGWYCSKSRPPATLTERDLALFGRLCPEPWQVGLMIRPSTVEASYVALCFRGSAGLVVKGLEHPLKPFELMPAPSEPAIVKPAAVARPAVVKAEIPSTLEPMPIRTSAPAPLFQFAMPVQRPAQSRIRLASWALVVSAIVAGTGAAFFAHPEWLAAKQLRLSASDSNGHLTIRWNPRSVRGVEHASVTLNDGGEPLTIPLDGRQLDAGAVEYERKSAHVDALMQAGSLRAQVSFPQ